MNLKIALMTLIALCLVIPAGMIKAEEVSNDQPMATSIDVTLGTTPTVDGVIGASEWTDASSISVTQTSGNPWVIYFKHTLTDVYFYYSFPNNFLAEICFDTSNDGGTTPQTDDYKMHSSAADYEYNGNGNDWGSNTSPVGWAAEKNGFYNVKEFRFSFSKLGITSGEDKTIGVMFHIMASPSASDGDWPSGADTADPSTWGTMSSTDLWGDGVPLNYPPVLENGAVDPTSGFTIEEFTYSVDYSDENNDEPTISQVLIDGSPFDMATTGDTFVDGVTYSYTGFLDDTPHDFYFIFNDGKEEVRHPETGEFQGPDVITPNSPPELVEDGIPNGTFSIEEDSGLGDNLIDLEDYYMDDRNDGDLRFEITYQESPSILLGSIDGQYLDITQMWDDFFGTLEFRVRAIDNGLDGAVSGDDLWTESNTFTIEVTPTNDDPAISRVGSFVITEQDVVVFEDANGATEDEWFNFTVQISDVDFDTGWDDPISYDVDNDDIDVFLANGVGPDLNISFFPTNDDVGWTNFTLSIEDSHEGEDSIQISITTMNLNDVPYFEFLIYDDEELQPYNGTIYLLNDLGAVEGEWYNFTMSANDEDQDIMEEILSYTTNSTLPYLEIEPESGDVSILPTNDDVGVIEFYLTATDLVGASDTVKIVMEIENTNDAPTISLIRSESNTLVFMKRQFVNLTCEYDDIDMNIDDMETVTISWESDIDGILGNGETLSTNGLSLGNHTITATATNSGGLFSTATILIMITDPPVVPEPNETDPNATGPEKIVEKEGAPVGLIIVIVIIAIIILVGVVVLLLTMRKKEAPEVETVEETPEEQTAPEEPTKEQITPPVY